MSKANLVLGVASVGLAVVGAFLLRQLRADRELIDHQALRIAQMEHARAELPAIPPGSMAPPAAITTAIDTPVVEPVSQQRPTSPLLDPVYRAGAADRYRYFVREQLRELSLWIPMSDQAMDGFAKLIATHEIELQTLMASSSTAGQRDNLLIRQESEIAQLLGEEQYRLWGQYRETAAARETLIGMNALLPTAEGLKREQIRPVATAMTRADQAARQAMGTDGTYEASRKALEAARAAAMPYLTARQRQAFDENLEPTLEELRLAESRSRAGQPPRGEQE